MGDDISTPTMTGSRKCFCAELLLITNGSQFGTARSLYPKMEAINSEQFRPAIVRRLGHHDVETSTSSRPFRFSELSQSI